jgi:hypothetical protein
LLTIYNKTASIQAAVEPYRAELNSILQEMEEAKFNGFTINQRLKLMVDMCVVEKARTVDLAILR